MNKWLLVLTLIVGLTMRGYQIKERFLYTHDNDLSAWIVKDIVVDGHQRLIGQLTSQPGIFIGPLFYYSLIPFFLFSGMDPVGTLGFGIVIGILGILSIYYVFKRLFGQTEAIVGSVIYAASWAIASVDREIVPTTPVILWTVWFFYAVNLVFRGDKKGLYLSAVLIALIWHFNLALLLLVPLVILGWWLNRRKFTLRQILISLVLLIGLSTPLIAFEARHNFSQTKALISSFTQDKTDRPSFVSKLDRTVYLIQKNVNMLFWQKPEKISFIPFALFIFGLTAVGLYLRKDKKLTTISLIWLGSYALFFSAHSIVVSEYYLHGMNIIWIAGVALIAGSLRKQPWLIGLVLILFIGHNFYYLINSPINRIGYLEKKAVVDFIARDASGRGYPCVSVSYITNPGYELGYRYLFWQKGLHVNRPLRGSPVYSIVFPHSLVDSLDETFGALGLVRPDYSRYTKEIVDASCAGENENLTEPMFGFTK